MDMGTGKTLTTIGLIGEMFLCGVIKKMLVVCPKSIVSVWKQEFNKFADFGYTLKILEGTAAYKSKALKMSWSSNKLQVAVINYESAWRMEMELADWQPDIIVCDESSKIKNPQAKQSKALHRLGRISKYNMILTGTPILNSSLDFYSQYKFLDEKIFGTSFYVFRAKYAILGGYGNHQIVGYKNLDELTEKAHSVAFRVRLDETVDLPTFIDKIQIVELEPNARSIYDDIERESFAELDGNEIMIRNILTQLLRLSQCTGGFVKTDNETVVPISTAKLDALADILEESLGQDKKVVVFARFLPEIDAIARMLRKDKIGYALICGGTKDRAEQVSNFQNNPNCKVFVGQLQTTGMGLTLTAASVVVFYSLDFSSGNHEQSRARVHRIGQTRRQIYYYLIAKNTIDEKILEALQKKKDVAKLVVDFVADTKRR
jgi:SNF2 family DNA or RNA helicase